MPVATTVNVAVWPRFSAPPTGCVVIAGATIAGLTVRTKVWFTATPLLAVSVRVMGEPAVSGAVPLRTPEVALSESHAGWPVMLNVGAGLPLAVTVKAPSSVALNDALERLVKIGAAITVLSVAAPEVASGLMKLLTTTRNWSLFNVAVMAEIVRVAVVTPP